MAIRVHCPSCGKPSTAPDNAVGRKARCRHCQAEFRIEASVPEAPPMRIVAQSHPAMPLPDMSDLSLRARALQFLERPQPVELDDHSLGYGLIRAYAEGASGQLRDPNYLKTLAVYLTVLMLSGKSGSPDSRAYVAEEQAILQAIKAEMR